MKEKIGKIYSFMWELLTILHYKIVAAMADSWIVENILIAKIKDSGESLDCIYCTILRNAVLFTCIGYIIGFLTTLS